MGNNLFYKALAAISTVGIIALAGNSFVRTGSEKDNEIDEALANTRSELTQARKDALVEVKEVRKEILNEIKTARKDALDAMKKTGGSKNSERVWLVIHSSIIYPARTAAFALEKIEMKDMDHCEEQGAVWQSSDRVSEAGFTTYECLTGK